MVHSLGRRINEILGEKNILQKDLARALGVQKSAVSYFMNDARKPNIQQLGMIADFLGVTTDYLLGRTDTRTPDIDVQSITDKTGLSEASVYLLTEYGNALAGVINELFDGEEGRNVASQLKEQYGRLCAWRERAKKSPKSYVSINSPDRWGSEVLANEEMFDVAARRITDTIGAILRKGMNDHVETPES